jgi:hypothetical protein
MNGDSILLKNFFKVLFKSLFGSKPKNSTAPIYEQLKISTNQLQKNITDDKKQNEDKHKLAPLYKLLDSVESNVAKLEQTLQSKTHFSDDELEVIKNDKLNIVQQTSDIIDKLTIINNQDIDINEIFEKYLLLTTRIDKLYESGLVAGSQADDSNQ